MTTFLWIRFVKAECLELVHKLVNNVPKPNVRLKIYNIFINEKENQLNVDRNIGHWLIVDLLGSQNLGEQVRIIHVTFITMHQRGAALHSGVQVAIIQFFVENYEERIFYKN